MDGVRDQVVIFTYKDLLDHLEKGFRRLNWV